jgi:hypothetical protein
MGIVTVLCGDPLGQLQDFDDHSSGPHVMQLLDQLSIKIDPGDGVDWRAKDCPRLRAAKAECWCQDEETQLHVLMNLAREMTLEEVTQSWHPDDIVIEPTRKGCDLYSFKLEKVRLQKYPTEPRRLKFSPKDRAPYRKKGGVIPTVSAPDGTRVLAAINSRILVPADTKLAEASPWVPDIATTIHGVQGATIKAPRKIFICVRNMGAEWCKNAYYVAMSRAERADQLVVFR